ncbi:MAG: two-component sensor histidine kinase [Planctomycetota bacterium]
MDNIYKKKSRTKKLIVLAAIAIAVISLLFTNRLSHKIADEEEAKVRLWAEALQERANLINVTSHLFDRIAADQRKDIDKWAKALELTNTTENSEFLTYLSGIVTGNTTIPAILTDENNLVLDGMNIDYPEESKSDYLDSLLKSGFSAYPPLIVDFSFGKNYIYYSDSKIFSELKTTIKDLTETFISEIVSNSASLPVLFTDENDKVINHGNIEPDKLSKYNLKNTIAEMKLQKTPLEFDLGDGRKRFVYYSNSALLAQVNAFPYIQFFLFSLLIGVAYIGFSNSRRSEQNRVWVGMAKETAHQLGTPISSLSAWVDYMKELEEGEQINEAFIVEVEKDINRLTLIADRFSKIGSKPDLKELPMKETLERAVSYMHARASKRVTFEMEVAEDGIHFFINESLFNWVIENLIKNALDAMEGEGQIKVRSYHSPNSAVIDICDTGKGIPKSDFETVFQPGYSTKKRGWGLGLSLVKRIVEKYHKGKIFIKESNENGTTFRIKLPLRNLTK